MLCPAFHLGRLLAPGILLLIYRVWPIVHARKLSVFRLLASGHGTSVVLELVAMQEGSVGCAGLGTAAAAGVQSVASPHIAPRAPLPGCAQHFRSASSCQICSGCYFCALNSSQSEGGSNKHSNLNVMCPAASASFPAVTTARQGCWHAQGFGQGGNPPCQVMPLSAQHRQPDGFARLCVI